MHEEQRERISEKHTDINRLEGEIMRNEEEIISLKQTVTERKVRIYPTILLVQSHSLIPPQMGLAKKIKHV